MAKRKSKEHSSVEKYVLKHYAVQSVAEMAKHLGVNKSLIYYYTRKYNIKLCFKSAPVPVPGAGEKIIIRSKLSTGLARPPTIYTNSPSPFGLADELHGKKLSP